MTIVEKILASHSGNAVVRPGEIVECTVDIAMTHDATARIVPIFREMGGTKVWDREKLVVIIDHWVPAESVFNASNHVLIRDFAKEQGLTYFYDVKEGVCHQVLPEKGHVLPGRLIIAKDSHTTSYGALGALGTGVGDTEMAAIYLEGKTWLKVPETIKIVLQGKINPLVKGKDVILHVMGQLGTEYANYRSIEFTGDTVAELSMDSRLTMCNMSVEMGAKCAFFAPDRVTEEYLAGIGVTSYEPVYPDEDASYAEELVFDLSDLKPQLAAPSSPDNVNCVDSFLGVKVDQVYLGSCTNGRIEDLDAAYRILKDRKIARHVRMYVSPASRSVYLEADKRGYLSAFVEAGAVILHPTCGACHGSHMGLLAPGEVCISTCNRNYPGRMGSIDGKIYLANAATAAACAVAGEIVNPETWL